MVIGIFCNHISIHGSTQSYPRDFLFNHLCLWLSTVSLTRTSHSCWYSVKIFEEFGSWYFPNIAISWLLKSSDCSFSDLFLLIQNLDEYLFWYEGSWFLWSLWGVTLANASCPFQMWMVCIHGRLRCKHPSLAFCFLLSNNWFHFFEG